MKENSSGHYWMFRFNNLHAESQASERKKIVRYSVLDLTMKRIFSCASKNENDYIKLEKDELISPKT